MIASNTGFSLIALLLLASLSSSCAKKMALPPPPPPPPPSILGDMDSDSQRSLFRGDESILSDQDIARILGTQVDVTDRHRLAILNLSPINPWSENLAQMETKNLDGLVEALRRSPQLTEVRFLPAMLVPEKQTVPYLREAAARVQADLLLVYSSRIQSFRRDRFLKADEVHAQCIAESVLLDVRTGIVVHTGHDTETLAMKKAQGDLNFEETIARAQADIRGKTLLAIATGVSEYLASGKK